MAERLIIRGTEGEMQRGREAGRQVGELGTGATNWILLILPPSFRRSCTLRVDPALSIFCSALQTPASPSTTCLYTPLHNLQSILPLFGSSRSFSKSRSSLPCWPTKCANSSCQLNLAPDHNQSSSPITPPATRHDIIISPDPELSSS